MKDRVRQAPRDNMSQCFLDSGKTETETEPKPARRKKNPQRRARIMPLGGAGEIGMNMTLIEYGNDIIAVDCGQMIPDDELLGIDMVIPDINYVIERANKFRAILITHAHEDHTGALPYLLEQIKAPVYATRLTCEMVRERMKEFDLEREIILHEILPREIIRIGDMRIEPIQVTHSIPGSLAFAIRLPFGNIIFSGDYKIDPTPPDGQLFDYQTFARYGEEGVIALFADSTNIGREGTAGSERAVIEPLDRIFQQASQTIIFSCFASSLHRIQIAFDLAVRHGKKVFVTGLNMHRNLRIASETGALRVPHGILREFRELKRIPPGERMILTTGSQGETMSALNRMALGEHADVKINIGDTVVLSSRIIPGNDKAIYRMINHLFRRGAQVIYESIDKVHVSGHAHREEIRTLISLCKPRYLVPLHGEFRHLVEHKALGVEMGIDPEKIFILQNGDVLEFDADGAARAGRVEVGRILVDGHDVGIDEIVLRDRRHLSEDGMVIIMLVIDQQNAQLISGPDIVSRGFLYMDENEEFFNDCKRIVLRAFNDCEKESKEEWAVVKDAVRRALKKYIKAETGRFPVILP
ncbi:MAG: ribonuclease J, partial [bacterium]